MSKQVKKLDWTGQVVFVGIDVHKKTWKVAACTSSISPKNWPITIQAPFVDNLCKYLEKNYSGARVICGYEAGFCGYWIAKALTKRGIKTLIFHASDIPTTDKERRQKEDKRDARKIAKALRDGDLEGIYIPSDEDLKFRDLVRQRYRLVSKVTRCKNQIRSHLATYNIVTEDATDKYWSNRYIKWLEQQSEQLKDKCLSIYLEQLRSLRKIELKATRGIAELIKNGPKRELFRRLMTTPGVGRLTAAVLVSEICDMARFKNQDQLYSYVGMIPRTNSSGESERTGKMTPRSNRRIKTAIIEASWITIKHDPSLMLVYEKLKKRMSGQKAIVKVARKLLSRVRHIWLNKEDYKTSLV